MLQAEKLGCLFTSTDWTLVRLAGDEVGHVDYFGNPTGLKALCHIALGLLNEAC